MTESLSPPKDASAMPGTPQPSFSPGANELSHEPHVSTGATGNATNTNTNNLAVYTNTIPIPHRDYIASIKVPKLHWKSFLQKARQLGFTGNELINQFINSVISADIPSPKPQVTFNIAIAKAESKPVINVGEYVAMKDLEELMLKAKKLEERATREAQLSDMPMTFTVEQARKLEEAIKKALKGVKSLDPQKLQEVEAALQVLRGIREGKA